jgi:hypothetical protein
MIRSTLPHLGRPHPLFTALCALSALFACVSVPHAHAAKDADLPPQLAKPLKQLEKAGFEQSSLPANWKVAKGDWQVRDGVLVAKEKADDKHAGVCAIELPNGDSIIRFSYRLQGAKSLGLSLNHAKGHLFRVNLTESALVVNKDKDKKDSASNVEQLGKADLKGDAAVWRTVQLEMLGSKITVTTDDGVRIEAAHPALDVQKTGYRFVISGESAELDDVQIWAAGPNGP